MKDKHVIVYSTPTCAFCKTEKQWLDSKGVKYDAVDITEVPDGEKLVEKFSGQKGVPVTVIWNEEGEDKDNTIDQVIVGFQRDKLSEALGL